MHEQIITCRQLFEAHVVGSVLIKGKNTSNDKKNCLFSFRRNCLKYSPGLVYEVLVIDSSDSSCPEVELFFLL